MGKTWLPLFTATLLLIVVLLVAILFILLRWGPFQESAETTTETVTVVEVIDGDTGRLKDGRRVRYLGINAPEKGDPHAKEATLANRGLVEGKTVRLEFGRSHQDQYRRLLAYVSADDIFVNETLLRQGHAHLRPPVAGKYQERLCRAQAEARSAGVGIWERSAAWGAIRIASVNAKDEFIVIENQSQHPVDFNGWTVSDAANHLYLFSNFTLVPKAKVTLRTGLGVPSDNELFWGSRRPIWNNKGDSIIIRDIQGGLVLSHTYGNSSCYTNP